MIKKFSINQLSFSNQGPERKREFSAQSDDQKFEGLFFSSSEQPSEDQLNPERRLG